MVSFTNNEGIGVCLSSDAKPTNGVRNGDMMLEMDTGKIYLFDADSSAWMEWTTS